MDINRSITNPDEDKTWNKIIDQIIEELDKEDLPDDVIKATEYMLAGYSLHETAKLIGKTTAILRRWLQRYPPMAIVLADQRNSLIRWRMNQLDRQFLGAIQRSQEILDIPLTGRTENESPINTKLLTALGQHVRFILGLYAGQKIDVQVTHQHEGVILQAQTEALDYVAQRLAEQREHKDEEPIEATYRIIDAKFDTGPMLTADGEPHYGEMGVLDKNEDGYLCHMCGVRRKQLHKHIQNTHNIPPDIYELTYMLDEGSTRSAKTKK